MPASLTYPGVYIEEISSGVRTIAGVATSITAFVGRTDRGPVDEPTIIHSFADFERIFGGLSYESTLSYAVRDFYLNGGQEAIILRLYSPHYADGDRISIQNAAQDEARSAANKVNGRFQLLPDGTHGMNAADQAETWANEISADPTIGKIGKDAAYFVAEAARNAVTPPTLVADEARKAANKVFETKKNAYLAADAVAKAAESFIKGNQDSTAEQVIQQVTTEAAAQTKIADDALATNPPTADAQKWTEINDAVKAVADAAKKIVLSLSDIKITVSKAVDDAASAAKASAAPRSSAQISYGGLIFKAANPGSWGNKLRIRVDNDGIGEDGLPDLGLGHDDLFNLTVRDTQRGTTERFLNVTTKTLPDTSRGLKKVLESGSSLIRLVTDLSMPTPQNHGDPDPEKSRWTDDKSSAGVSNDLSAANSKPLVLTDYLADPRGIYSLRKVDQFNLLCIPPDGRVAGSSGEDIQGEDTPIGVLVEAMKLCVDSRAMLIVDPPFKWGKVDADSSPANKAAGGLEDLKLKGNDARNAILYFPRVIQSDPLREGQLDTFAPCGLIAGVIARTDTQRGIWKAPAGVDASMNGIIGLQVTLNDAENGMLNPLGINCLRTFPLYGSIVWGARTLRGANQMADEYKYVPVRRVALFIEESLYRGLKWVVFEPNDEPLWSQVRLNVGAFMHNLFRQGAFQGKSPREAYFVKCDKETTTQSEIDQGIVNVVVGFAPLKPAEFVVIKIQQMAGQIQT